MFAIETINLEKTYAVGFWRKKPRVALRPLNLAVEEGEVFGFLGPNGAGKTTTLKLLMGLVLPTGGTARILGKSINEAEVKAQIGFLPEQPYFYDYLTAKELLEYYARLSGVEPKERTGKIDAMLQRVGLAQAILHDPKVVFLDEPMSGLDPTGRREVRDLMEELKQQGKTVFFSTHILSDAEALCDRVAVIHRGELRGIGRVAELTASVAGKVEMIWNGNAVPAGFSGLGAECHISGDTIRAALPEAQQEAALEILRRERLRLISLTPVRSSLEEYYLQKVNSAAKPAGVAQ